MVTNIKGIEPECEFLRRLRFLATLRDIAINDSNIEYPYSKNWYESFRYAQKREKDMDDLIEEFLGIPDLVTE